MSEILLSFCIPVMDRLDDLKSTLGNNLDDNRTLQSAIEFIIICFDRNSATADWVHDNFAEDIAAGYLHCHRSQLLQKWHFGRAKNCFRGLARGRIYASLDADNYTGPSGGRHIIEVFEKNHYNCIFHQFQGDWGDGTCGRVSMPMEDYIKTGYDDTFLPRQWDEMDAILSTLVRNPSRKYVCYEGKNIAEISIPFRRFVSENDLLIKSVEIPGTFDPLFHAGKNVAVSQHDSNYVRDDNRLRLSSRFNHLSSFFKNTRIDELRNRYVTELVEILRKMAEKLEPSLLLDWFLAPQWKNRPKPVATSVILVSCIRNEPHLDKWLDHYRRLGVTHFFIIDDGSFEPIAERITSDDVWVWKPVCGKFRYSKAAWLELLLRQYCLGCWVVTADSDEYLELPVVPELQRKGAFQKKSQLQRLINWAESEDLTYFTGVLLDMAPGPDQLPKLHSDYSPDLEDFNLYQYRPFQAKQPYAENNTVRWSYGDCSDWAYRIDLRFRINNSFDSLRKFPVFKMSSDIHLNQGFHDLLISGEKRQASELNRSDLLVIRHYNLVNTSQRSSDAELRPSDAYHYETKRNIERLQGRLKKALTQAAISPFTYPFLGTQWIPVPAQKVITLRQADSNGVQISFEDVLNRKAEIPVRLSDSDVQLREGVIYARSLTEAMHWCMCTTPFCMLVSGDESHVVLGAVDAEGVVSEQTASVVVSTSWLSRGNN